MEGLDAWVEGTACILAAGVLGRHSRGRIRRRLLGLQLGAAVLRRASCGTNFRFSQSTTLEAPRIRDAIWQQRSQTWHCGPIEGTLFKEALKCFERHRQ